MYVCAYDCFRFITFLFVTSNQNKFILFIVFNEIASQQFLFDFVFSARDQVQDYGYHCAKLPPSDMMENS